ncbi:hypothetical protein Atai01_13680 [Amycolatopsis taiwanensis]|uniref:Uncharacterized protein n=1 Tax=Amycolatopsis taiwanensis TaxID=342230 RepID=A0A9W6VFD6_9PSEU|nr:hypothetical protein Atai01_13680 [Amycolatopsis taiwanensis]
MRNARFNCGWYLPWPDRRVVSRPVVIVVVILALGWAIGYGASMVAAFGAAAMSAVATEVVRTALRGRPRTA